MKIFSWWELERSSSARHVLVGAACADMAIFKHERAYKVCPDTMNYESSKKINKIQNTPKQRYRKNTENEPELLRAMTPKNLQNRANRCSRTNETHSIFQVFEIMNNREHMKSEWQISYTNTMTVIKNIFFANFHQTLTTHPNTMTKSEQHRYTRDRKIETTIIC